MDTIADYTTITKWIVGAQPSPSEDPNAVSASGVVRGVNRVWGCNVVGDADVVQGDPVDKESKRQRAKRRQKAKSQKQKWAWLVFGHIGVAVLKIALE